MRKGKIIVASMMVLCVLIFVAAAAWFMLFQGEMTEPTEEEKQAAILHAAGLMKSETQDKKSVETLYHRYIIQRQFRFRRTGGWQQRGHRAAEV